MFYKYNNNNVEYFKIFKMFGIIFDEPCNGTDIILTGDNIL